MMNFKTLAITLIIALGNGLLFAESQPGEQQQELVDILRSQDLPKITQMIQYKTITWPKLLSDESEQKLVPAAPLPSVLGLALLDKIREYETKVPRSLPETLQAVSTFGNLAKELQNSGGYINFCLADAANRVAVERLAQLLDNHPETLSQINDAFSNLKSVQFSPQQFLEMVHSEPAQSLNANVDLISLDETTIRERVFAAVGSTDETVVGQYMVGKAGTTDLINKLSIDVLLQRISQTDIFSNVALAGIIEFYKRGGKVSDIRADNIGPFKAVMQGAERQFKSDLMSIKQVRTSLLIQFITEARDQNNSLVTTALK